MKRVCLFFLMLSSFLMLQAQNDASMQQITSDTIHPPRLKVGVVLGGGGAKGAAHIGVLKYLEEIGLPIDYVAGTSMGSIIGGFYSLGYTPDELIRLISEMKWSEYIGNKIDRPMLSEEMRLRNSTMLLQVPFSHESLADNKKNSSFISQLPSAYVNNSSLVNLFNDLCIGYQEEMDFNDLPIPFACVATDMITGKEVVLRRGSVSTAMRASMAIPGVFSPVTIGDMVLVDGGLVNNFPADVLRDMGADIIIGVEVTSTKTVTADDLKSLPQVFARLLITSTSAKRQENRAMCDVHIVPDITGFGMLSFTPDAIDTLVGRGYKKAHEFHDQLLAIKEAVDASAGHPVSKTLRAPHAKNLTNDSVLLRSIVVNNVSNRDSRWLIRKGELVVGNSYTKDDIERAMNIYRGTGCYDEITYQIKECDSLHWDSRLSEAYDLSINMKPAQPHVFGLGIRYDTEEGAAILLNFGLNEKRFNGSKLNFSTKLSYNPRINLTYTYSRSSLANFNMSFDYRNEHFRSKGFHNKYVNLHYQQMKANAYISEFHLLNFSTSAGVSYIYTTYDKSSFDGNNPFDSVYYANNAMWAPFVKFQYDNLDDAYFANHGLLTNLGTHFYYVPSTKDKYFDFSYAFQYYITPNDGRFTIIPQLYGRYVTHLNSNNSLVRYYNIRNTCGGEIAGRHFENQMPFIGLASVEDDMCVMLTNNASILRCDLRYNFYGKHYLTAMYNASVPWGMWGSGGTIFIDIFSYVSHGAGLKYSYNSFLGPVSLTAHWINSDGINHFGAYFSFGYTF